MAENDKRNTSSLVNSSFTSFIFFYFPFYSFKPKYTYGSFPYVPKIMNNKKIVLAVLYVGHSAVHFTSLSLDSHLGEV